MSSQIEKASSDKVVRDSASDTVDKVPVEKEVAAKTIAKPDRTVQKLPYRKTKESVSPVTNKLFSIGFIFALVLTLLCLSLSVIYLFQYLNSANTGITQMLDKVAAQQLELETGQLETLINGRLVMARLGLLSCGVLAGFAFGFLGFALFLLGIKETLNVDFEMDTYRAKAARMSPGVFSIVVAAILIGVCATRETPFNYAIEETKPISTKDITKKQNGGSPTDETKKTPKDTELAPQIVDDKP